MIFTLPEVFLKLIKKRLSNYGIIGLTNHLINKVDTFIKTDTIKVPITITKTVTKAETQIKEVNKLYWWQRLLICLGLTVLIFGVISIIRKTKKLF